MKRFWITVLCVLVLFGAVIGITQAETAEVNWEITGGTLYIRGNGDIPYYISGTAPWFARRAEFTSIVVEEGITGLSDYCFVGCDQVTSVDLPESLTRLAEAAFASCYSLKEITIPEGITTLSSRLFHSCEKLEKINLPQSLTTLGESVFEYCTALKTIDLPQSVTNIGKEAFGWSGIETIDLPDNVSSLHSTFRGCENLVSVDLPENLLETYYVFDNCHKLTQLTFPAGIKSVGWYTATYCDNLKRIIFTGALPSIDLAAFNIGACEYYYPKDESSWHNINVLKNYGSDYGTYYAADPDNICTGSHVAGETKIFYIPNSCLTYGANAVTCKNCSALELVPLKPSGHAYLTQTVSPGATTNGYTFHFCAYCNWQYYTFPNLQNLTYQDALLSLKNTMAQRHPKVSFRFLSDVNLNDSQLEAMYQEALENDGNPMHGDYMSVHTWHHSFRSTASSAENGKYWISVTFEFLYQSNETEEMYVNNWLAEVIDQLKLDGKTDFEKIRTIHDWVTHRINYDYTYSRAYPYEALRDGVGVCQAYALLTQRLMITAGIDCRYISGNVTTSSMGHAWNIVKLDGQYYHVDTTWDDPGNGGMENYDYFLLGTDHFFEKHIPDPEYATEEFYAKHPCSATDYLQDMASCGDGTYCILYPDGTLEYGGNGAVTNRYPDIDMRLVTNVRVGEGITALPTNVFYNMDNLQYVVFAGDKPAFGSFGLVFRYIDVYYPQTRLGWDSLPEGNLTVTWKPYLESKPLGSNIRWFLLADGTLELFGKGEMDEFCKYQPWVSDSYAFIQKIIIHQGITNIGERAFASLSGLREVYLPASLTDIGKSAFMSCRSLTEITLPEGLAQIGDGAFQNCAGLTDITFPESMEKIDAYAFSGCTGIRKLEFLGAAPEFNSACFGSVTATGYYKTERAGWDYATSLYLGGDITWVGISAITLGTLSDFTAYLDTPVEVKLEAMGENLHFAWYLDGEKVGGDENPLLLYPEMEMDRKGLYCIVTDGAGNQRTSNTATIRVYDRLLVDTPKLISPGELEMYSVCFTPEKSCVYNFTATGTEHIFVALYKMEGGWLGTSTYTDTGFTLDCTLEGGKTYLLLLQTNREGALGTDFFLRATKLHGTTSRQILEPATCTSPGEAKDTCTLCGDSWFVTYYADHSYENGFCTFCGKAEPTAYGQLAGDLWWELVGDTLSIYGSGAMPDFEAAAQQPWYPHYTEIRNVIIEPGVTYVGNMAFLFCTRLQQVSLPLTLQTIGKSAFSHCINLQAVELPGALQKLGLNSFYYTGLQELVIPETVSEIGSGAFANGYNLKTVTFLGTAPKMAADAFDSTYAEATHPAGDPTWTDAVKNAHPTLTWKTESASVGIRGDLDQNGQVNTDDVVLLLLNLSMPDVFGLPEGVTADFNSDGFTTTDDAVLLLLHISMPDVFPL